MSQVVISNRKKRISGERQLTEADFLNPKLGDRFVQGSKHYEDVQAIWSILSYIHRHNPTTRVYSDLKILFGRPHSPDPAPDIAVIPHVTGRDPSKIEKTAAFNIIKEGTRPSFILEVVSPQYRRPDREDKVHIYEQAGVNEYFIVDANLKPDKPLAYEIVAYRLIRGEYHPIVPDDRGWYYSMVNHVWFGVTPERDRFFVIDGETEEEILSGLEQAKREAAARAEAEAIAKQEAAARASAERQVAELQAEIARLRGQDPSSLPL